MVKNPTTLIRVHPVSPGGSGSDLAEHEAGRATYAAGVLTHLTPSAPPTRSSRCITTPKVDGTGAENGDGIGVELAPTGDVDGTSPADRRVVFGTGDVTS
jgi:hypothetical protein